MLEHSLIEVVGHVSGFSEAQLCSLPFAIKSRHRNFLGFLFLMARHDVTR